MEGSSTQSAPSRPNKTTSFHGINHLKLPCHDITKTQDFYTRILPFVTLPQYNHYTPDHKLFAVMFMHEQTKLIVEARYEPDQAAAQKSWDPVTWGVGTRKDLQEWAAWFDHNGVKRSAIMTGIKGWLMAAEDPDGRHIRLYVEHEDHEWTDNPTQDDYWLRNKGGDPNAA